MSTIAEAAHLLMCSLDNEAGEKKKKNFFPGSRYHLLKQKCGNFCYSSKK